jgi:hypothetical protein
VDFGSANFVGSHKLTCSADGCPEALIAHLGRSRALNLAPHEFSGISETFMAAKPLRQPCFFQIVFGIEVALDKRGNRHKCQNKRGYRL